MVRIRISQDLLIRQVGEMMIELEHERRENARLSTQAQNMAELTVALVEKCQQLQDRNRQLEGRRANRRLS